MEILEINFKFIGIKLYKGEALKEGVNSMAILSADEIHIDLIM